MSADSPGKSLKERARAGADWCSALRSFACWVIAAFFSCALAQEKNAAIASAHPLATAAGHAVLARGGNAFDAAVAVAATLAVVEPYSSGLGGGGFWLLHRAADGREIVVDSRETAPRAATPELFLDRDGNPLVGATTTGGKSVAIPGIPAALAHIAHRYGRLALRDSLAPAIRHAREGFPVDARYARVAALRESLLQANPHAARIFLHGGRAPQPGWLLRQPELAATLERLAAEGERGFYGGSVARALVEAVNRAGGVWQLADLAGYRVLEREPLRLRYRGAILTTVPPPSAGGVALAQALGMLERFEPENPRAPHYAHLVVEALRRAFEDRARYLGDPDFTEIPLARITSPEYLAERARSITETAPRASAPEPSFPPETYGNTTHFSIVDAEGNRVAATLSINHLFGSGILAAGVLLNNEMDDFSLAPGHPDSYRLRGGAANAVAPGKRPLSSMTPTFVEDGKGVLVLGAPGGPRIVSQVLLAVLDYLYAREPDLARLVAAPRYHHQGWPDRVELEPEGFPAQWRAVLEAKGHRLQTAGRRWGNLQVVFVPKRGGGAIAASDPRGTDVGWY